MKSTCACRDGDLTAVSAALEAPAPERSGEFIERRFRFLSAETAIRTATGTAWIPEDVLLAAVPLFAPRRDERGQERRLTVYSDHDVNARSWCGTVLGAEWVPAAGGVPAGIEGIIRFDRVADPRVARGVEVGALSAVSTSWRMRSRQSHPAMSREQFDLAMMAGASGPDGRPVGMVAVEILRVNEVSVVWEGAGPHAGSWMRGNIGRS